MDQRKVWPLKVPRMPPGWKPVDPLVDPDVEWFRIFKESQKLSEKAQRPGPFSSNRSRWEICLKRAIRRQVLGSMGVLGMMARQMRTRKNTEYTKVRC